MKTLIHLKELLRYFASNNNYSSTELVADVRKLVYQYPLLLHVLCDKNISLEEAINLVERLKDAAIDNYIPYFPSTSRFIDVIGNDIIETPAIRAAEFNNLSVSKDDLTPYLLNVVLSLPIKKLNLTFIDLDSTYSYDFILKNISPVLYNKAPITTKSDLNKYIDKVSKRFLKFQQQYRDYSIYCTENKTIPTPYEIIVVIGNLEKEYQKKIEILKNRGNEAGIYVIFQKEYGGLQLLNQFNLNQFDWIINGSIKDIINQNRNKYIFDNVKVDEWLYYKGKISYEVLREAFVLYPNDGSLVVNNVLKRKAPFCFYQRQCNCNKNDSHKYSVECFEDYDNETGKCGYNYGYTEGFEYKIEHLEIKDVSVHNQSRLLECIPITENKNLLKVCLEYINNEAEKKESIVIKQDFNKSASNTYEKNLETITIPIGKSSKAEVNFTMDMVSHVHSFIIGQSGSGKSVFLHNIIGSSILKYAPEDLQLYLLDFKLGGVEFNRYKGIKHVKSLLVDNSDQQITLEILRELRERMVERGRQLRDCGVNNLVEYNKQNPNATMPQILLVVDECHEMFRVGRDIPRTVSNEISEIITKIAKEGRSQGVHLILATQTLSGTEISNEILNNVSDHYLLKCAPVDSERMVERSTEITSQLSTGQIYYHHVDSQVQFQAYYTDKENAEKLIDLAKKKAENHQSNGEFYFNGSQLFKLDETVIEQGKKRAKYPVAYMGKNISISQNDQSITLRKDYSENILLFGLNDVEQVTRTTMNLFISLISYTQSKGLDYKFKVFNCLSNEDSIYTEHLEMLEEEGYCEIIEGRKDRGKFLKQLAEDISNETVENTILLILGQERFRELKMDMEIAQEQSKPSEDDAFGFGGFSFSNEGTSSTSVKTFKQALELILDKGPEFGVHTIMQLDKPSNFLFSDYISPKMVYQKFKHLIMLKSDEAASAQLHLNDNIRLETLSKDLERLRAYYYSEESDTYTLFTPYMELSNDEIMNLLKTE